MIAPPSSSDCCRRPPRARSTRSRLLAATGDSLRDLQAMHEAGGKTALVLTGKGKKTLSQQEKELPENTQVFDSLLAFSQYIMHESAQDLTDGQANP